MANNQIDSFSVPGNEGTGKRLADIVLSLTALLVFSPVFGIAAAGIRLSSPGPVLYRAKRVGLNGAIFTMKKYRTMHIAPGSATSAITAKNDRRVFTFGAWLRRLKIDELPQLLNILNGEMSIVGPRPEDPTIVEQYYTPADRETLRVKPGLASPGSIYNYTHGEQILGEDDTERRYVELLLPRKLAIDTVYVREATFLSDLKVILHTILVVLAIASGWRHFPEPPELERAIHLGIYKGERTFSAIGADRSKQTAQETL